MIRWLVSVVAFVAVLLAWSGVARAQSRCPFTMTGTIEAGDATQDGRVKNGATGTCAAPKVVPVVSQPQTNHRFDKYTLKNRNAAAQCVTLALTGTTGPVESAAYAPAFVPTNPQTNYLGDSGGSAAN